MKYLITTAQKGPALALKGVARELERRGHEVTIYATGSDVEASGFGDLPYQLIAPDDCSGLVRGFDAVVTGFCDLGTADTRFVRAANVRGIPTVAVLDQNNNYESRVAQEEQYLPSAIAVMTDSCRDKTRSAVSNGDEVARRMHVVGWTALDHIAAKRDAWSVKDTQAVLEQLGFEPGTPVYAHLTQTIHPDSAYMGRSPQTREWKQAYFDYERDLTKQVFAAAADLGLKLIVKPHPGEAHTTNTTKGLADHFGMVYVEASACATSDLMLASHSVSAGRSSALQEATLFDRNTGAFLPGQEDWVSTFPPLELGAIPYAARSEEIPTVLAEITSADPKTLNHLAEQRKRFSVDGKASQRCADLIERLSS